MVLSVSGRQVRFEPSSVTRAVIAPVPPYVRVQKSMRPSAVPGLLVVDRTLIAPSVAGVIPSASNPCSKFTEALMPPDSA